MALISRFALLALLAMVLVSISHAVEEEGEDGDEGEPNIEDTPEAVIAEMDKDGDAKLSKIEIETGIMGDPPEDVDPELKVAIDKHFLGSDADGDGSLDATELSQFLRSLDQHFEQE